MPDRLNSELLRLQNQLGVALGAAFHKTDSWASSDGMTQALTNVRKAFDSSEVHADPRSSIVALTKFRETGRFPNFIDLKYGCFGICLDVHARSGDWSVITDESLLRRLLKQVDEEREHPRRFSKCYQALMHSYFSFPIFEEILEGAVENWKILQRYLGNRLEVALSVKHKPTWLMTLNQHSNLVSSRPCEPYSDDLLRGNRKKLVAAAEGIGIGAGSWVWQTAMVTAAETAAAIRDDSEFRSKLNFVLDVFEGDSEVTMSESVVLRCLAMVLNRYAKCSERPEHPRLRDLAIHHIGNPWLKRPAWDAYVKNDAARKMVDGWLKRRLISDFFALLAEDGSADQRRLNYWLQFEQVIEDMWFVLGSHARSANSSDFHEMRKRMEGRLHYLNGQGSPFNNAFLMKIENFLIVEFGVIGNATYIFHADDSQIDFSKPEINMYRLKGDGHIVRLIHRGNWESDFDQWLLPRLGRKSIERITKNEKPRLPVSKKVNSENIDVRFQAFISSHKLLIHDFRNRGGAMWIDAPVSDDVISQQLISWGFQYNTQRREVPSVFRLPTDWHYAAKFCSC